MTRILLVFILLLSLFSCGESRMQKTMERIRTVSDSDTKAAARMMDSISVEVKSGTEYTRMRYDLMKIRIDDKNDVKPMSDKMIAYLVKYFEENGNYTDRQEAYFYAAASIATLTTRRDPSTTSRNPLTSWLTQTVPTRC